MRVAAAITTALLLSACASGPKLQPPSAQPSTAVGKTLLEARVAALQQVEYWEARGRLAATAGDRSATVSLIWQQRGGFFDIYLVAPLGQGVLNLVGDDRQVVLSNNRGETVIAPNAETLFADQLGVRVPIVNLRDWVLGVPARHGGVPTVELDEQGRPKSLLQDGWLVNYPSYREVAALSLPEKVFVKGDDMAVKLVIERWDLSDPNLADAPEKQVPAPITDVSKPAPAGQKGGNAR